MTFRGRRRSTGLAQFLARGDDPEYLTLLTKSASRPQTNNFETAPSTRGTSGLPPLRRSEGVRMARGTGELRAGTALEKHVSWLAPSEVRQRWVINVVDRARQRLGRWMDPRQAWTS
ncbi:hypothetical protein DL768_008037 [Monosporascus sp. mg162]|nr:hypothetical protein DL768_008037 [Monosporascus sp. mg162]